MFFVKEFRKLKDRIDESFPLGNFKKMERALRSERIKKENK